MNDALNHESLSDDNTAGDESNSKALLIGCRLRGETSEQTQESLEELTRLVLTAGATEFMTLVLPVVKINPATFISSDKVQTITEVAKDIKANLIVFDNDLSPSQQRNIEAVTEIMVMDRTGLILDIFASRAWTKEGKLQVELAQLEYLLPRLRGMWTHLSRQGAGIGTRGPGETDLEVDRRRITEKITRIKKQLLKVKKTRALHHESRKKVLYPTAVLVGYTNAGKSTLLNRLTDAGVLVEDKLFATLDPTVRELRLPMGDRVLLSDTVGFIRKLPHQLVESFSATFEEITRGDLLLHLVDASHPNMEDHIAATQEVLGQIDVEPDKVLMLINKIDRVEDRAMLSALKRKYEGAVLISAVTGEGMDELYKAISARLAPGRVNLKVFIPYTATDLLSRVKRMGKVKNSEYENDGVRLWVEADAKLAALLAEYVE